MRSRGKYVPQTYGLWMIFCKQKCNPPTRPPYTYWVVLNYRPHVHLETLRLLVSSTYTPICLHQQAEHRLEANFM